MSETALDFVYQELIGWLWFTVGRSHVTDRLLSSPWASKHAHKRRDLIKKIVNFNFLVTVR